MTSWKDGPADATALSTYECFDCGTVVEAESNPATCPDCGGELRNRSMPVE
ncbi:Protein of unknown function [Halopelagius inordinatus]|uniref:DUF7129 domain-containing protein n=1 Tax=Halopelagius inordinatus TaxID=553467 RepID=A0A1I2RYY1_9EURY|nr:rubrerythrin-like domain-containing protein [Halopelagius inordinatus]SFG45834.1 Protein of unknown function [Halopelagius inordinatus]